MRIHVRGARVVAPSAPGAGHGASSDVLPDLVDVVVEDGRVVSIGAPGFPAAGDEVVEAAGRLLLPGLVDAHVHAEAAVFEPEVQKALLRQGVTSIVLGQDGVSCAPSHDGSAARWAHDYFRAINGRHPTFTQGGVGELLETYDRTVPVNVAYLAPHGALRYGVMGAASRPADRRESTRMQHRLAQALEEGACGMSTGLEYVPGRYADGAELSGLCEVLREHGRPHVSHMRGYQARAADALTELLAVALRTGVATHVSHLHGPGDLLTTQLDDARRSGLDVTFDSYPYLRGASVLSMLTMPPWVPVADVEAALACLLPGPERRRVLAHLAQVPELLARLTLSAVPGPLAHLAGSDLITAAQTLQLDPPEVVVEVLRTTRLRATCVFDQPPQHSLGSVRRLLAHPAHMAASDGIYGSGHPHPRGWGTFARLLSEQVLDTGAWTWGAAVRHCATAAVERFALGRRGRVEVGADADLVLVDPGRLRDRATYDEPRRFAVGIDDVLVRGVPVLRAGELTGRNPGRPLRPLESL